MNVDIDLTTNGMKTFCKNKNSKQRFRRRIRNWRSKQKDDISLGTHSDPINLCDNITLNNSHTRVLQLPRKFVITPSEPPDFVKLKQDVESFVEKIRWKYLFQKKDLDRNGVLTEQPVFTKTPWYIRTDKMAPKASLLIEEGLNKLKNMILDPSRINHYKSNLSKEDRDAIVDLKKLCKDKKVTIAEADKSESYVLIPMSKHKSFILENLGATDFVKSEDISEQIHKKLNLHILSVLLIDLFIQRMVTGTFTIIFNSNLLHKRNIT